MNKIHILHEYIELMKKSIDIDILDYGIKIDNNTQNHYINIKIKKIEFMVEAIKNSTNEDITLYIGTTTYRYYDRISIIDIKNLGERFILDFIEMVMALNEGIEGFKYKEVYDEFFKNKN